MHLNPHGKVKIGLRFKFLSPLHWVTLTVLVDKSLLSEVLSQGVSISDQQTILWVCILSFSLQIPEQLELHVLHFTHLKLTYKRPPKKQLRELQPHPIIGNSLIL